jgi:hypothetical protein
MDQSRERIGPELMRPEMTNSDSSPLHPGSFGVPGQGPETNGGGGGGGGKAWVCTWSTYAQLVPESGLQHTQDLLDVT